jgi:hypothetical protein
MDENTKLSADEKAVVFTWAEALTVKNVKDDADKVDGFYSRSTKEIIFRDSAISAGAVAHEMAHAYAGQGWHDFIDMMQLRGMKDTDKLNEGMTTHIASLVVTQWHAKQPSNTIIPSSGYDTSSELLTYPYRNLAGSITWDSPRLRIACEDPYPGSRSPLG